MYWITLDTAAGTSHAKLLGACFEAESVIEGFTDAGGDTAGLQRQLDWADRSEDFDAQGWLDIASGSMVLIEAVGTARSGSIVGRIWVAATNLIVQVVAPIRYDEGPAHPSLEVAASQARSAVRSLRALADLPG